MISCTAVELGGESAGKRWSSLRKASMFPLNLCINDFVVICVFSPMLHILTQKKTQLQFLLLQRISPLVALLASWGLLLILIMRSGDCEAV